MRLDNKGFTLVEVLAVVVIIAILGMIAIPSVISVINTGKDTSYNVMISNIVTASQSLYEEVDNGILLYHYDKEGDITTSKIVINISTIETSLQTLVSNGFLGGSNDKNEAKKRKRLFEPKTQEDIGYCMIKITKVADTSTSEVKYLVEDISNSTNDPDDKCPSNYKEVSE